MRTVLGLSKTSTSIGWVLVDRGDVTGDLLDHDAFDATHTNPTAPAATARRVRDIATATGYTVDSVHVTTSGNVSSLRDALRESGFAEVTCVSLPEATRAWAMSAGRENGQETTALCVLGRDSASLSVINTRSGAIESASTTKSFDGAGLADWLDASMGNNGSRPECLYLIGCRSGLDAIVGGLEARLSVPVVATHDAQLALARGAAFSNVSCVDTTIERRPRFASPAWTLASGTVIVFTSIFTLSAASGPIRLAENESQKAATPPVAGIEDIPQGTAPVAPLVFPPPPPKAAQPVPEKRPAASIPAPAPVATGADLPAAIATPEPETLAPPETVPAAPPVQHLPDEQPAQHLPETQPAGPAPGPVAPPSAAPAPAASIPASPETVSPPPPDPVGQAFFGDSP